MTETGANSFLEQMAEAKAWIEAADPDPLPVAKADQLEAAAEHATAALAEFFEGESFATNLGETLSDEARLWTAAFAATACSLGWLRECDHARSPMPVLCVPRLGLIACSVCVPNLVDRIEPIPDDECDLCRAVVDTFSPVVIQCMNITIRVDACIGCATGVSSRTLQT